MIVYKTTNLINGKIYIGKDFKNDIKYLGSGKILKYAIKKYGKENFKKEIIQECLTKEELNIQEQYWIKKLKSQNPKIGYNIANGGQGGKQPLHIRQKQSKTQTGKIWINFNNQTKIIKKENLEFYLNLQWNIGRNLSLEQKTNISNKNKINKEIRIKKMVKTRKENGTYILSEERKLQIKKQNSGKNNPFYGKHHSEETKRKISKANKGKNVGNKNSFYGKHHSEETKRKISKINKGKMYIYNENLKICKMIKKTNLIPNGWKRGRKIKFI